jgi:hypothetical protein
VIKKTFKVLYRIEKQFYHGLSKGQMPFIRSSSKGCRHLGGGLDPFAGTYGAEFVALFFLGRFDWKFKEKSKLVFY